MAKRLICDWLMGSDMALLQVRTLVLYYENDVHGEVGLIARALMDLKRLAVLLT